MNDIKVNGTQIFMGIEIPVIEGGFGENQKIILAKTVAKIHGVRTNDIQDLILQNIDEFEFGVDILDLCDENFKTLKPILKKININIIDSNRQRHCFLLSSSGYLKYYNLIRNKNEYIFNIIMNEYFEINSDDKYIHFVQNKEIRFRNQLSIILNKFKIRYQFQYPVFQYRIDIYLPDFNIAIEYDENAHKHYTYEAQELREMNIKNEIGCKFIRVTDEYSIDEAVSIILSELFEIKKELIA